jgi:acyl-[acyl-carrier-protein]-phospholipid O-acyltransferase/long-chain-fatty-acid--[acyl-carrier-protein] ligase
MKPIFQKSINRYLSILKELSFNKKKENHSLWMLNITQFLGVINDNLYKLLLIFLFIHVLGQEKAPALLSAAGIIYVLPFLLFSSSAGILADRYSKQKIIQILKGSEVIIMALVILGFYFESLLGSYVLLFFLATHSAMFGPSKYGIIPELVTKDYITKANGLITSFTYMAMIIGTFLASFLTHISDKHFIFTAVACLTIAILGFISSLLIEKTPAQESNKQLSWLFIREISSTLQFCRTIPHLRLAILGSAFFLFIGAFAQLNMIPFAIHSLHLSEIAGGYLFLILAIGIAAGSFLCGRWMKKKVNLQISCFAGLVLSLSLIFLEDLSFSLTATSTLLIIMGIAGGVFVIPFDSFIQINSPIETRGQVIAATNFLSFIGVLVASISIFLLNGILDFSPGASFRAFGLASLLLVIFLSKQLWPNSIQITLNKILWRIYRVRLKNEENITNTSCVYVLENATAMKLMILRGVIPDLHPLIAANHKNILLYRWMFGIEKIDSYATQEQALFETENRLKHHQNPCLCLNDFFLPIPKEPFNIKKLFNKKTIKLVSIYKNNYGYTEVLFTKIS